MKILLAVSDTKQKTQVYVTDDGRLHTALEMIELVRAGKVPHMHVVVRKGIEYVRANRGGVKLHGIDRITLRAREFVLEDNRARILQDTSLVPYWDYYQTKILAADNEGALYVAIGDDEQICLATRDMVRERLLPLKQYIYDAAHRFSVDEKLLAGIVVDEIVRMVPFEEIRDKTLTYVGNVNTSVGPAQVKVDTAREIIASGVFNPNPADIYIDAKHIGKVSRAYLLQYVLEPRFSILFGAAQIRRIKDFWQRVARIDIAPDIVATLYSQGLGSPHIGPKPSERGLQIVNEFVPLATHLLNL
jgi:hypothetical protein